MLAQVTALRVVQRGVPIYLFSLPARKLKEITKVDHWTDTKSIDDDDQGYQRPSEPNRKRRFGRFIAENEHAILPTPLLVNDRNGALAFDESTGLLTISERLFLYDGQHREGGFEWAIEEGIADDLPDFPVIIVASKGMDKLHEMELFRVVNGEQKSVRTDLVTQILAHIASKRGDSAVNSKDIWKIVCARAIEDLANDPDTVWFNRVKRPSDTEKKVVPLTSFLSSLKPLYDYLIATGQIQDSMKTQDAAEILATATNTLWEGIRLTIPGVFEKDAIEDFVIQKTPGIFGLHRFAKDLYASIISAKILPTPDAVKARIELMDEFTDSFWHRQTGEARLYTSQKGFAELAQRLSRSLADVKPLGGKPLFVRQ